nr:reverse transcriptase domain-containing protein [Tanacetum cinerariifolium]
MFGAAAGEPGFSLRKNHLLIWEDLQRFDESFGEALDRFKDLLPGGNLLNRTPRDALTIIENKSKVRISRNKPIVSKVNTTTSSSPPSLDVTSLTEIIKELVLMNKAIEETCMTYDGPHPYYECLATGGNTFDSCVAVGTYNQGGNGYRPQGDPNYRASNQMGPPGSPPPNVQNSQNYNRFIQMHSPSGSGSLSSNTVANPRGDVKDITTRSGVAYEGPLISPTSSLSKEVEREPKVTKDKKKLSLPELTPTCMTLELANRSVAYPVGVAEDVFVKVGKIYFPDIFFTLRNCFVLEEIKTFLHTPDELSNLDDDYYDTEGHILYLEKLLNENPSPNLPPMKNEDLKQVDVTMTKPSIELELKDLPSHLEYAFLEGTDKLPVIISKELKDEEKAALLKILKSHKWAIACKISDVKGIDPRFCTHKILMEDEFNLAVQHQRRVNPKIHEVIKKEVIKLLEAGLIYPISDSPWIHIDPQDQENTTFTYPYGTFAYRHIPFGLCNAPGTFHRCMMAIFYDMIKETIEVFMDDFLVFKDYFSSCLSHLGKMLKRCEDTNLVLNWEKCHFMVKEGIVPGHKISKSGIEVDRAKVNVIAKLPHPTSVKGVRSFLGHVGFYRRFVQDFSKIAWPMTHLLEKETLFIFLKECIEALNTLKKKLTEASILVAPDWDLPFESMCDASDFAIAGSESRPPMLNKENYVPLSYRLLRYAKSRPNRKLIPNSILNGPYVRKMIPKPGDANYEITVTETFHLKIDDELFDKELKQIEADDQATQTILLGLPEDIYPAADSCETDQEIWLRVQQMMKGSDIGIQEKKAKLFNEWERNKHFQEKIASNLMFLNNLQPEWSRHVTIVHQTKDLHTADYTQLYDFLKYNQKEVDELKAERLAKTQDPLALMVNSNNPYVFLAPHQDQPSTKKIMETMNVSFDDLSTMAFKQRSSKPGLHSMTSGQISSGLDVTYAPSTITTQQPTEENQISHSFMYSRLCVIPRMIGKTLGSLVQKTDNALVYDTNGSVEVHEIFDDNEIFNMFTQEEQYTELLEPIPESHQVP